MFGDIFSQDNEYEENLRMAEENIIMNTLEGNRTILHELNARYIKFLKLNDSIMNQKTQLQWFREGDTNSKYFHSLIILRTRRLFIHRKSSEDREWFEGNDTIGHAPCDCFQKIFTGEYKTNMENMIECIPRMVSQDHNEKLINMQTMEELKEVVFLMI